MALNKGVQQSVLRREETLAGTAEATFAVSTDSLLTTLFVEIASGSLDVGVYAITVGGTGESTPPHEVLLYSFPTINAPTVNLLVQSAAAVTQKVRIKATWTGSVKFDVQARAIDGGASKTQVITAGSIEMDQKTINTGAPQVLIPLSLVDGVGFLVKNWSINGAIVYVAETSAKAIPAKGFPVSPGDCFDVSVKAGQAYYASSTVDGADLRIIKGGE
jgi:hypothetical protein